MRSLRSHSSWPRRQAERPIAGGAVPLGDGRMASLGVGGKAARLDEAAVAGLAVPVGFLILDQTDVPSIDQWMAATGAESVAVRSAFSAEDRQDESLAGWFDTVLHVDAAQYPAAVADVRSSAAARQGRFRRDVLVMEMVSAVVSGVAFSEPGTYDDLVNVTSGTAERLVQGDEAGEARLLARLEREPGGWPTRLQRLLRGVRREFGDEPWDVEWADDGRECWLVQLRPITARPRRNEAFTIANHAEILPPLPSTLMTSVIAEAGDELFGWYRQFDASLPADRPFLEVLAGRPFINLTLLEDLLRHLGLPTRLVADSIGGPPENDRPLRPSRLVRKSPVLLRMGLEQLRATVMARQIEQRAAVVGDESAPSFGQALDDLHQAYVGLVTGMFPLSSAIGPPLALLRRAGTISEHTMAHQTITTRMAARLDDAQRIDGAAALEEFLGEFGHRGVYESDIARPRFRDDPALLGTDVAEHPSSRRTGRTWRGRLTLPLWWAARRPLDARERLRHEAMKGFASIRSALTGLADGAVARGQLPNHDALWLLDAAECRALDQGWIPDPAFWDARRREREHLANVNPPPIVHRFEDPADWDRDAVPGDRFSGLSLTDGVVAGSAWVLQEPSLTPPHGFDPASTVLIARSVDAGWIPTFALVAGVVVETGGDLSHGSILLRERGLPAITNASGVTRAITTGESVELRAGAGIVERRDVVDRPERSVAADPLDRERRADRLG